jgi:hypothetical protein
MLMHAESVIHRSIVVNIHMGKDTATVAVIARTARGTARRRDNLLWRGTFVPSDVSDTRSIMRAAGEAVLRSAESLR